MSPLLSLLFRASIGAVLVSLALMVLDLLLGWALPQPLRSWLPYCLMGGFIVALTLGVGTYGAAKNPRTPPADPPAP